MKTAVVTGSAGLVGRYMVKELEARGWAVVDWDITQGFDAHHLFTKNDRRYDLVVHAAYWVGGREGIDGINRNFAKNLALDAAMFEWAMRTKQHRVLYFSSSAAYPVGLQSEEFVQFFTSEWPPGSVVQLNEADIDLDKPQLPDAGYGWAKLTGERLAEQARRAGVPVTVVRPFSGYSEDQSLDYPFPSIVDRARKGDLTVWGRPGQTRDWIHIEDVVAGALAVVDSETTDPVNLCTGVPTEMGELAQMIYGRNDHPVHYLADKPTGVHYRVGDPKRFNTFYTPKITIQEGIARALAL